MKLIYDETNSKVIEAKVGMIVVVKKGTAFGNRPGTITKITRVNTTKVENYGFAGSHWFDPDLNCCCEDSNETGNPDCKTKIPSYFELCSDVRKATAEEREIYFNNKRNGFNS